jgi:hypothetical protein
MKKLAKRICFKDNKHIRIINKGGMDCIVDFMTGKQVQTTQIDNFEVNFFDHKHSIKDQIPIAQEETLDRLINMSQDFKFKQQKSERMEFSSDWEKLLHSYKAMYKVDYSQEMNEKNEQPAFFSTEMSFTYLDWHIIDKILNERDFDFSNIDEE